mgnify:CR=1 FL=1
MKKIKPLVSICIPTYNRSEYLLHSLKSLSEQIAKHDGEVEVVISDNASTDDTKEVCENFCKRNKFFHYYRNDINVKDKNFGISLSRGNGELLKLSKDTAIYKPDAVERLLNAYNKYVETKPQLYFSNNNFVNTKTKRKEYDALNKEDFMLDASYWITDILSFSVWKEDFLKVCNDSEGYELNLWQVDKLCKLIDNKNSVISVNHRLAEIEMAKNKDLTYGLFNVFHNNFISILRKYNISEEIVQSVRKDLLLNFFSYFVVLRKSGRNDMMYSNKESFEQEIRKAYHNEKYYKKYVFKVLYLTIRRPFVKIAKKILRRT